MDLNPVLNVIDKLTIDLAQQVACLVQLEASLRLKHPETESDAISIVMNHMNKAWQGKNEKMSNFLSKLVVHEITNTPDELSRIVSGNYTNMPSQVSKEIEGVKLDVKNNCIDVPYITYENQEIEVPKGYLVVVNKELPICATDMFYSVEKKKWLPMAAIHISSDNKFTVKAFTCVIRKK